MTGMLVVSVLIDCIPYIRSCMCCTSSLMVWPTNGYVQVEEVVVYNDDASHGTDKSKFDASHRIRSRGAVDHDGVDSGRESDCFIRCQETCSHLFQSCLLFQLIVACWCGRYTHSDRRCLHQLQRRVRTCCNYCNARKQLL